MNTTISYKWWFVLTNTFTILINISQFVFGFIFILIILSNRTYRSISNFLAVNTAISIMFLSLTILFIVINMCECDRHPDECTGNKGCFFRDYINNVATTSVIYSLVVQSIHRYLIVVYSNKVRLQRYQIRLILCILQWLLAFLYPVYFIYISPQLQYDAVSYVCVISNNNDTFLIIYLNIIDVVLPFTVIVGVYLRLFIYVRRLRRSLTVTTTSKRELIMAKRIFFLLAILALGSITLIIFQSIKPIPDYEYRVYYLSVTITSFSSLICMFIFTPQVKQWLILQKNKLNTRIHPQITQPTGNTRNRY